MTYVSLSVSGCHFVHGVVDLLPIRRRRQPAHLGLTTVAPPKMQGRECATRPYNLGPIDGAASALGPRLVSLRPLSVRADATSEAGTYFVRREFFDIRRFLDTENLRRDPNHTREGWHFIQVGERWIRVHSTPEIFVTNGRTNTIFWRQYFFQTRKSVAQILTVSPSGQFSPRDVVKIYMNVLDTWMWREINNIINFHAARTLSRRLGFRRELCGRIDPKYDIVISSARTLVNNWSFSRYDWLSRNFLTNSFDSLYITKSSNKLIF